MPALVEPQVPFRWDLISPDHLGTLLDGVDRPNLWFAEDLTTCAGKALARSGDGDLFFVGRSLDQSHGGSEVAQVAFGKQDDGSQDSFVPAATSDLRM